jgi:hypothetical protein
MAEHEPADGAGAAREADNKPLTIALSNGVECEAPILKPLRECERDCERPARAIRPNAPGLVRPAFCTQAAASPIRPATR